MCVREMLEVLEGERERASEGETERGKETDTGRQRGKRETNRETERERAKRGLCVSVSLTVICTNHSLFMCRVLCTNDLRCVVTGVRLCDWNRKTGSISLYIVPLTDRAVCQLVPFLMRHQPLL